MSQLPPGYTLRAASLDDAQAFTDLVVACDIADDGVSNMVLSDVLDMWSGLDVPNDVSLVVNDQDTVVGSVEMEWKMPSTPILIDGYVHPEHSGQGIGRALLAHAEQKASAWAAAKGLSEFRIRSNTSGKNQQSSELFALCGYQPVRYFYRMVRSLDEPIAAPVFPEGITVRPVVKGQDERAYYDTLGESFADHWEYNLEPFEQWLKKLQNVSGYLPETHLVAYDGDQPAAILFGFLQGDGSGWVRNLGVRRPWRKRGLGFALLQQVFHVFQNHGCPSVGLGVDADSPTGATHLYERAGMHVEAKYITHDKQIRLESNA